MQNIRTDTPDTTKWVTLFILAHIAVWTLAPSLLRCNLPLDSIEGTLWGHQLEWGYDKNPYLNGWLTALAIHLDGYSGWMVYLFSQLSVGACFWSVWQLGKRMLPATYALVAVLVLEGIQYYHFHAIDFNDNTLELGLWGLATYSFYLALRNPKYRYWLCTGLFAGLGMMAKYYTAALLAGMLLFLVLNASNRQQLKTLPPYVGLMCFLAVVLPHLIWLVSHEFITVTYVFARASHNLDWTSHFYFPTQFAWQQFEVFFPAVFLTGLLWLGRSSDKKVALSSFDKTFLFYVGLGPFLLTLLLSFVFGINLRAGWGMPLQSLWGIILIAWLQPNLTPKKLSIFVAGIFLLMATLLTGYAHSIVHSPDESSANFPGKEIAATITQQWRERYHTKLDYVAGSRWIGGNIGFYSPDHPAVFNEWNTKHSPWIHENALRHKGAVFVWDITSKETLPEEVRKQYPQLKDITVLKFEWQRDEHHLPPIQIGVALLPPSA